MCRNAFGKYATISATALQQRTTTTAHSRALAPWRFALFVSIKMAAKGVIFGALPSSTVVLVHNLLADVVNDILDCPFEDGAFDNGF